jgi:hypothetical protein
MTHSKGISWIDDCRIPFVDEVGIKISGDKKHLQKWKERDGRTQRNIDEIENTPYMNTQGRFPANLLVCDDMLNDGIITKTTSSKGHIRKGNVIGDNRTPVAAGLFGDGNWIEGTNINDKGTNSRYYDIDKWFDKIINYE